MRRGLRPGDHLVLRVGQKEFDAYVEEQAGIVVRRGMPSRQAVTAAGGR
jgi:hypothetical protein